MDKNTEKVDLIRKVYSKTEYPKIVDTKFQQLGVISVNEDKYLIQQQYNNFLSIITNYFMIYHLMEQLTHMNT